MGDTLRRMCIETFQGSAYNVLELSLLRQNIKLEQRLVLKSEFEVSLVENPVITTSVYATPRL